MMDGEKEFFVHESSYVDDDVVIGKGTRIWYFCHIQSGTRIGENCNFGQNVNIGNNVKVGDRCKVQNNVSLYEGVELGSDVFCGPSMVFTNDLTPRAFEHWPYLKTVLHDGCSVGANATIVCGHEIGRYAMVAAGAVVTDNVPDYALVMGVPARMAGYVCRCGQRLHFAGDKAECRCGKKYRVDGGKVSEEE